MYDREMKSTILSGMLTRMTLIKFGQRQDLGLQVIACDTRLAAAVTACLTRHVQRAANEHTGSYRSECDEG